MEERIPESADVEALHRVAPLVADEPLDELACEVIQRTVKERVGGQKRATTGQAASTGLVKRAECSNEVAPRLKAMLNRPRGAAWVRGTTDSIP
jgi:hypothetical protein